MTETTTTKSSTVLQRKRRIAEVDNWAALNEEEEVIEYADGEPPIKKVTLPLVSGKDLMHVFCGSTKIFKKFLPSNAIFLVTNLKTVDVRGTDQAGLYGRQNIDTGNSRSSRS